MVRMLLPLSLFISWATMAYYIFIYIAPESTQGNIHKLFYFHVSSAIVAFTGYSISFLISLKAILKNNIFNNLRISSQYHNTIYKYNLIAIFFSVLTLITGAFWAKPVWGVYWNWNDNRLITFFVMLLFYLMYVVLVSSQQSLHLKLKIGIFWNILCYFNIPIVYFSIRLWGNSIHPQQISISTSIFIGLMLSIAAHFFLFLNLAHLKGIKYEKQY